MTGWTDPVIAALERAPSVAEWFFRDDDAGWADARLSALVDVFDRGGTMLDLAAIPAAVSRELASSLRHLVQSGAVAVHQHGWAHVNHQPAGRRSEFGSARAPEDQLDDLRRGRALLSDLLYGAVLPVFTPPWNRCEDRTVSMLEEVGLTALSCDVTAPCRNLPGVAEVPVHVDWSRCWREGGPSRLGTELCRAVDTLRSPSAQGDGTGSTQAGEEALPPIGVMLHHAVMTDEELVALARLLGALSAHPTASLTSMCALVDGGRQDSVALPQAVLPRGEGRPATGRRIA